MYFGITQLRMYEYDGSLNLRCLTFSADLHGHKVLTMSHVGCNTDDPDLDARLEIKISLHQLVNTVDSSPFPSRLHG